MVRSAVAASLVGAATADYQCPGGPWVTHAGLRMTSTAAASCDTVKTEMRARVAGENGWYDQHNRGTYTEQDYGGDISYSRLTGDGKYTDKMTFVFTDQGGSCKIEGCSEAQVFSIADFSTNYCEQKLLYCGSDEGCNVANSDFTHTEDEKKTMAGSTTTFKDCLKVSESPKTLEEMADHINSLNLSWKAEAPKKFGDFDDVKMLCGTVMADEKDFKPQAVERDHEGENIDIPTDFDVRTNWPDCAVVSNHIRDQSACGSCWAFGSTEAFNDRRCIATGDTTLLSTTDTAANCDLFHCFSFGCGGGQPGMAWDWFVSDGVVTGGDYEDVGKGTGCAPYPFQACAHHVPATDKYPACPSGEYDTPTLSKCSEDGYGVDYSSDKIKAASSYSLSGVANIQTDIMQFGTVTAAFTVYEDFPTYKSGVYRHSTGSQLGGHAIKILGWGVEDGVDYWLVANSWNDSWGNGGTFKIVRGENHCGIEGQVSAGHAAAAEVTV